MKTKEKKGRKTKQKSIPLDKYTLRINYFNSKSIMCNMKILSIAPQQCKPSGKKTRTLSNTHKQTHM